MAEKYGKYCPINSHPQSDGMCQKGKCEWWVKRIGGINIEACSIRVLAENVFFIQEYSSRITK